VALIRGKFIGERDLHQAALYTLDAIANTVGGRNSLPGKLLCQWGKEHHGGMASAQSQALIEAVMGLAEDEVDWGLMESVFPREVRE
jgi:hypothetical protein